MSSNTAEHAGADPGVDRRRSWVELWPQVGVISGVVWIVAVWLTRPVVGGDTGPLMTGTEELARCLNRFDLTSCDQTQPIGPYPILQHVPDLVAHAGIGLSRDARIHVLAVLSAVGVLAALGAAWIVLRRAGQPEWRWAFLVLVAGGPALAYGGATWGEMLAAGMLTAFVGTALVPARPAVVALAAFGASLTKETSYPFVLALGVVSLLLARRRLAIAIRSHVIGCVIGVALALALSSGFNLLRFGTPRNAYYLDPALRTANARWFVEIVGGLFASPNGGIVFFWPLACLLVVSVLALPVVSALRGAASWRDGWPVLALIVILAGLVAGLAAWWAPFGWWAWGPRLSLPWVLPIVLLSLVAFGSALLPRGARILTPAWALVAVATIAVLTALPHVGYLWRQNTVGEFFFFHTTAVCPEGGPPPSPSYYDCLHEEMWLRRPIWLDSLAGLYTPGGIATAAAVSIVVVGSLVLLRRELCSRRGETLANEIAADRVVPYRHAP